MNKKIGRIIIVLAVILLIVILLAITHGSVKMALGKLILKENQPILSLRFLRIFAAIIAGTGLAAAGIVLQAILRNPLAEPYLLGTSSGAGLGTIIALLIGISRIYLPAAAFCGAILSVILVYNLAKQNNRVSEQSLILSGVIASVALSAIIVFLVSLSGNEALGSLTWWLWGSFQVYDFKLVLIAAIIVFSGTFAIYIFSRDLNAMSIGEEEARHLGIDTETIKKILIIITALVTASIVCICGIIGFVGLIIPHMMRLVVGANHRLLIPVSCIAAAVFMVFCDILSRCLWPPLEIPIGVITALLGAPVFIILLKKKWKLY